MSDRRRVPIAETDAAIVLRKEGRTVPLTIGLGVAASLIVVETVVVHLLKQVAPVSVFGLVTHL